MGERTVLIERAKSDRVCIGDGEEFHPLACEYLALQYEHDDKREEAACIRLGMPVDHASHIALLAATRALNATEADTSQAIAELMLKHSFATGHGDTSRDMLGELDWQIADRATHPHQES